MNIFGFDIDFQSLDMEFVYVSVAVLVSVALVFALSSQKKKHKVAATAPVLVDKVEPIVLTPSWSRWQKAPSEWAKYTFLKAEEIQPVSYWCNVELDELSKKFVAYNDKLKLPGKYDSGTGKYWYADVTAPRVKGDWQWIEDNGTADAYIKATFPTFNPNE